MNKITAGFILGLVISVKSKCLDLVSIRTPKVSAAAEKSKHLGFLLILYVKVRKGTLGENKDQKFAAF